MKGLILGILKLISMIEELRGYSYRFGSLYLLMFIGPILPGMIYYSSNENGVFDAFMLYFIFYFITTSILVFTLMKKSQSIHPNEYLGITSDLAFSRVILVMLMYGGLHFSLFNAIYFLL